MRFNRGHAQRRQSRWWRTVRPLLLLGLIGLAGVLYVMFAWWSDVVHEGQTPRPLQEKATK